MARICSVCNKKIGLMTGYADIVDGKCCMPCWEKAGFTREMNSLLEAKHYSAKELKAIVEESYQNDSLMNTFQPTKTIQHKNGKVEFDDNSKTFIVTNDLFLAGKTTNLYRYDQIRDFKLIVGQNSKSSGNIGRGAIGGALFGNGGAVVGAMSDISTKRECTSLRIKLTFRNSAKQTAYISFINSSTSMGSLLFRQQYQAAQAVLDLLSRAVESYKQAEQEEAKQRQAEREVELKRKQAEREAEYSRQEAARKAELEEKISTRAKEQAKIQAEYDQRIQAMEEDIKKSKERIAQRRARIAERERQAEERRKRTAEERKNNEVSSDGSGFSVRVRVREVDNDEKKEDSKTPSAADEILKFKQLLDAGIITEEEFQAKKKQLLGL